MSWLLNVSVFTVTIVPIVPGAKSWSPLSVDASALLK